MVYDPLKSNQNKLFNWQPFVLTEILPEEEASELGPAEVPGGGGTGPLGPQVPIEPFAVPLGAKSTRSEPWDVEERDDGQASPFFTIPVFETQVPELSGWIGSKIDKIFAPPTQTELDREEAKEVEEAGDAWDAEEAEREQQKAQAQAKPKPVSFQADVLASEIYNYNAQVSTAPVDAQGNITDHFHANPMSIQVNAVHSDNVFAYIDSISNVINSPLVQGASNLFQSLKKNIFGAEEEDNDKIVQSRTAIAFAQLTKWHLTGQPLKVECKYAPYGFKDDLDEPIPFVIQTLSIPRDAKVGRAIRVNMTLRQIQLVTVATASTIAYDQSELSKQESERQKELDEKAQDANNAENLPACLVDETMCLITGETFRDGKPTCSAEKAQPVIDACRQRRDDNLSNEGL